jgi:hypothetical protein
MARTDQFEHELFIAYVGMPKTNEHKAAEQFFGTKFFKVLDYKSADQERYKPGAREYRLFCNKADWIKYSEKVSAPS